MLKALRVIKIQTVLQRLWELSVILFCITYSTKAFFIYYSYPILTLSMLSQTFQYNIALLQKLFGDGATVGQPFLHSIQNDKYPSWIYWITLSDGCSKLHSIILLSINNIRQMAEQTATYISCGGLCLFNG